MTNTGVRHSEGSGGSSRAAPSTTPTDGASRGSAGIVPPTGVFLVGGSQAVQSNLGLVGSILYAPTKTILITEWTPDVIQDAASRFAPYDLRGVTVILWLYDEMVFESQEFGDPLTRSAYDGRLHCQGPMGVMNWRGMASLLDESRPLLDACVEASRVIIMAPLPIYMGEPCCKEPDHCFGHFYEEQQKRVCRGTAVLYQAMVMWLSWIDQPNFFIACPQVELMAVVKTLRVDEMSFLLAAYSYDGVHLSSTGYRDLFDRLAIVLNSEPWQYRPLTTRMADPVTAPVQAPVVRRPLRDRLGRRGVAHLPYNIEVVADRFCNDEEPRVFSAEAERGASRGNWQPRSRSRSLSPPISPSFWASVRATAPLANRPQAVT